MPFRLAASLPSFGLGDRGLAIGLTLCCHFPGGRASGLVLAVPDNQALGVAQRLERRAVTGPVSAGQAPEVELSHADGAENAGAFSQQLRGRIAHVGTVTPTADIEPTRET